jgi:hypothetical protein
LLTPVLPDEVTNDVVRGRVGRGMYLFAQIDDEEIRIWTQGVGQKALTQITTKLMQECRKRR